MKLINSDFLTISLPENSVDLIVTSPPYNIGIAYGVYKDNLSAKEYVEFSQKWLVKCLEILKEKGRLCINVPLDTKNQTISADITLLAKKAGFKYKGMIIWNKQNVKNKYSMVFSKNLEVILVFYKGDWTPVKKEFKDYVNGIWTFAGESAQRVHHPAPFPVEIPRRLIKMFSEKEDVILDPFLGSGTTLVACKQELREGIGVEINKAYCQIAKKRIISQK